METNKYKYSHEVKMPNVFTTSMSIKEALTRSQVANLVDGVDFSVIGTGIYDHILGQTKVATSEALKEFNKIYKQLI